MLEQKYQDELATSPQHYSSSPMGPLTDSASRRLLIDLISTMNASFPDYDFRCVLEACVSVVSVVLVVLVAWWWFGETGL